MATAAALGAGFLFQRPYITIRELSLAGIVVPDTRCPPSLLGRWEWTCPPGELCGCRHPSVARSDYLKNLV